TTNTGYGLRYEENDVNVVGQRASGVISIQLKEDEYVVNGAAFDPEEKQSLLVVTQRGACKRMRLNELEPSRRANRGTLMLRELKGKPHRIRGFFFTNEADVVCMQTENGKMYTQRALDLPLSDLRSNGSFITDEDHDGEVTSTWIEASYETPFESN